MDYNRIFFYYAVYRLIIFNKNTDTLSGLIAVPLIILYIEPCEIFGITPDKSHILISFEKEEHPLNVFLIETTFLVFQYDKDVLKDVLF